MEFSSRSLIVFVGALAGGIVNGLTGFGTAITVLGIWLYAIPPTVAATLAIICSIASQLQTLPMIWRWIHWGRVIAFVVPGLLGVPIGTLLLPHIDPRVFKIGIGIFLVAYSGHVLARQVEHKIAWGGRAADAVVGFAGGILGGLAGLAGIFPVVWADLRGWSKEQRRSLVQMFNIAILSLALVSHAVSGLPDARFADGGDRGATRHHRRRAAWRLHLSPARRPQLSARHHGAIADFRRRADLDQRVTHPSGRGR